MVIWVFAGGGQTEIAGLSIFLEANYPFHRFERKTPARVKPGPKPNRLPTHRSLGRTGISFSGQIEEIFQVSIRASSCDAILVLDDLDCHSPTLRRSAFDGVLNSIPVQPDIKRIIGFASPEVEAWLIADWEHTFMTDYDLRSFHRTIQYQLSQHGVDFKNPEQFSHFDASKNSCDSKLSDVIIHQVFECSGIHYSKSDHSPRMLKNALAPVIAQKCPEFRIIHTELIKNN
ncbi:MAG: hypothetical protein WCK35_14420 [Chloroflexota bacterium]